MQNKRPIINPAFPECPIRNVLAYDCNGFAIAILHSRLRMAENIGEIAKKSLNKNSQTHR